MLRILGAALVAVLLVSAAPAFADPPAPTLPSGSPPAAQPSYLPNISPTPQPPATPLVYTMIPCKALVAAAHVTVPIPSGKLAENMGSLWTAALRLHGFDKPHGLVSGLDYRKAQLDVDACFNYSEGPAKK